MEFREISTFLQVAQYQSFSKAARHLGYSQAAVTIQIKQLEQELGVHLFDRIGKQISLTHQGPGILSVRRLHPQRSGAGKKRCCRSFHAKRQALPRHHRVHLRFHFPGSSGRIPPAAPGGHHQHRNGFSRSTARPDERKHHRYRVSSGPADL